MFCDKILAMADVGPSGAEAIATFEDVTILTPRSGISLFVFSFTVLFVLQLVSHLIHIWIQRCLQGQVHSGVPYFFSETSGSE